MRIQTNIFVIILFINTTLLAANTIASNIPHRNELIFCVTGDSRGNEDGINKNVIEKTVNAIKAEKPSFVAVSGDLVSGYSPKLRKQLINWRDSFMKPLLKEGIKVYTCRGNHDASPRKTALSIWQKVFSGKFSLPKNGPNGEKKVTYFVKKKNLLLLVMDAYPDKPSHKLNLEWAKKVLKKEKGNKPIHLFIITHEPAFAVQHKDSLASKPEARDKLIDFFLSNGGVCYFCGHDHFYNHAKVTYPKGEFHQFVCGTLGAPLYDWDGKYRDKNVKEVKTVKSFGYMVVHIKGKKTSLVMKGWDKNGNLKVVDSFTYTLK